MKIDDLISEKNKALFDRVNKIYPVDIIATSDTTWGSNLKDGKTVISYCDTKYPEECFTHELLHIDTQIKGYKRLRFGFSAFDTSDYFKELMSAIDNELQHHKMFPDFLKMGYNKEQFYIDSDTETEKYLQSYLTKKTIEFRPTFLRYLTLIAPGGCLDDNTKQELKENFKSLNGNSYRAYFDHIDKQFEDWTAVNSYNAEAYLKEMFVTISGGELTWFGYGKAEEFPNNGFYVDKVFQLQQP
jgi:hypothetical protein